MKKLFVLMACLVATVSSYAQGTVNFNTRVPADNVNLRVLGVDGNPVTGANFSAQLYGGPAGTPAANLQAIGSPVSFRAGNAAGWIDAGAVAVTGVPGGQPATLQLRAWDNTGGATFASAQVSGASTPWTTGPLGDPSANPPTVPASLGSGTGTFQLQVIPEPSTIALGVLGAAALLLRRRK